MFFDYHRKMQKKNRRHIILGAMIASLVTGFIALLFAPKSGKDLRKDIAEAAKEKGKQAEEFGKKAQEMFDKEAKKLQERAAEVRATLEAKMSQKEDIVLEKIEEKIEERKSK